MISISQNKIEDYFIFDDDSDFILGSLEEQPSSRLDQMMLLEKENQDKTSQYWKNQHLLHINKLTGLSYQNVIDVLKKWKPEDNMIKDYEETKQKIPKTNP